MGAPVQAIPSLDVVLYGNIRCTILRAAINAASNGANTVVAAVAGKSIVVLKYKRIASANVTATWESSGGSVIDGPCALAANGGEVESFSHVGHFQTVAGEGLTLFLSGAIQVGGNLSYITV